MVELIVVTVLGALVLMAALTVLITNQRTYSAQSAVITGQQSTRMAMDVLFNELREVSPGGGDILAMSSDSIRLRLMRKFSIVCENWNGGGQPRFLVENAIMGPSTRFAANDSVFVFADNQVNNDNDDRWVAAMITDADTTQICLSNGARASQVTFNGQRPLFNTDSVGLGAPVRSYQRFTFALTTFNGSPFLGRRDPSGTMVPIAGPLRAGTGLEFVYRDSLGVVTNVPANVRQIVVRVRSGSGVLNSLGRPVSDSLLAWVYTRN